MNTIEQFVRGTLGCRCPDEVFRTISIEHAGATADRLPFTRLQIGDRLLIYVVTDTTEALTADAIARLARAGCRERDELGRNRFRLVLATTGEPERAVQRCAQLFSQVTGSDQRAHLHVVRSDQTPAELRPATGPGSPAERSRRR